MTYQERIDLSISLIKGDIHPKVNYSNQEFEYVSPECIIIQATILPDKLDGKNGVYNNAVWCTYAHASR